MEKHQNRILINPKIDPDKNLRVLYESRGRYLISESLLLFKRTKLGLKRVRLTTKRKNPFYPIWHGRHLVKMSKLDLKVAWRLSNGNEECSFDLCSCKE